MKSSVYNPSKRWLTHERLALIAALALRIQQPGSDATSLADRVYFIATKPNHWLQNHRESLVE